MTPEEIFQYLGERGHRAELRSERGTIYFEPAIPEQLVPRVLAHKPALVLYLTEIGGSYPPQPAAPWNEPSASSLPRDESEPGPCPKRGHLEIGGLCRTCRCMRARHAMAFVPERDAHYRCFTCEGGGPQSFGEPGLPETAEEKAVIAEIDACWSDHGRLCRLCGRIGLTKDVEGVETCQDCVAGLTVGMYRSTNGTWKKLPAPGDPPVPSPITGERTGLGTIAPARTFPPGRRGTNRTIRIGTAADRAAGAISPRPLSSASKF